MIGNNWFKVWTDILIDPKVGSLDDTTWRRFFEMLALAAEQDDEGRLPETEQMAWALRVDENALKDALDTLEERGMVHFDDVWVVTNFSIRQSREYASKMRVSRYRERLCNASRNASVTEERRGDKRRGEMIREEEEGDPPPCLIEDVESYFDSRDVHDPPFEARKFYDYYSARSWVAKSGKHLTANTWKRHAVTWANKALEDQKARPNRARGAYSRSEAMAIWQREHGGSGKLTDWFQMVGKNDTGKPVFERAK